MNKKEKSLLTALIVGGICIAYKYFKKGSKKEIKELFVANKIKNITENYSPAEIEDEIYKLYTSETDRRMRFKAILFLTMIKEIDSGKYDELAMVALEELVTEIGKNIKIRRKKNVIREKDMYELIGDINKINAAIKLGIDECARGDFKRAKDIFKNSSETRELVNLLFLFYSDDFRLNKKDINRILREINEEETFLFLKSKVYDKNGLLDKQTEVINKIEDKLVHLHKNEKTLFYMHKVINYIKKNKAQEEIRKVIEEWMEGNCDKTMIDENSYINMVGVIIEWGISVGDKELVNKIFFGVETLNDFLVLNLGDCRYYLYAHLILPFLGIDCDKINLLEKALSLDKTYYKTYIFYGGETKDISIFNKALEYSTTLVELHNVIRIKTVLEIQEELVNN